ncbi:MAG: PAS domain S-box protein [Oligoflexia bacterium]|nr:PAS domain S-box protein [Oligoflexia bacterium]
MNIQSSNHLALPELVAEVAALKLEKAEILSIEKRNRLFFNTVREAIVIAEVKNGIITDCNYAAEVLWKRSRDELIGKQQRILHPKELSDGGFSTALKQLRKKSSIAPVITKIIRADGVIRDVSINTNFIEVDGQNMLFGAFLDITEEKQIRKALIESEERYRSLFENSRDAMMLIIPPKWKFTAINNSGLELFGVSTSEEFTAMGPWTISPEIQPDGQNSKQKAKRLLEMTMHTGSNFFEWTHKKRSGESFPATVLLTRVSYGGKTIIQATVRDITTQKKIESDLRESNARLNAITQATQDGIVTTDAEGRIIFWNPAAERILGYSENEAIGQNLHLLLAPGLFHSKYKQALSQFSLTGEVTSVRKIFRLNAIAKDHSEVPIELSLSSVQINGNWHAVGVLRDISEHIKIENERKKMTSQLCHASKLALIGTLEANVAHEINNPLTVILCAAERLHQNLSIKKSTHYYDNHDETNAEFSTYELIDDIMVSASRIATIVKELKNYARTDNDVIEKVDVHQCINETLNIFGYLCSNDNIKVETYLESTDHTIEANLGKLQQVIMNIISNSKDALVGHESNQDKRIVIRSVDKVDNNESLLIEISDNGPGISQEHIPKIFDPFFTTKDSKKGTGLGLAICHNIITTYGGNIEIESEVGIGTTTRIILPKNKIDNNNFQNHTLENGQLIFKSNNKIEDSFFIKGKVLIIDDEKIILKTLNHILFTIGMEVFQASNGEDAYNMIKKESFDYALLDLKMPKMRGDQLIKKIKQEKIAQNTKFILVTGDFFNDYCTEKGESLMQMFDGYIRKPFRYQDIVAVLKSLL